LVFAREDGQPVPPALVTKRFTQLVKDAGLRPVRLHDLRHGRASLLLAADVPLAVVSKLLGHSSLTLTADTYSHLLGGVGREAAERTALLVPRARRGQSVASAPTETTQRAHPEDERAGQEGAPPGTRTPNPLIKSQLLCQLS
jgi:hypothetical protein